LTGGLLRVKFQINLGTDTLLIIMDVNIYPNPSNGKLFICGMEAGAELSVCDREGKEIYHSSPATTQSMIDLSAQPGGLYFMEIRLQEEVTSRKIVLTKKNA
jgi:hypothetical protein